MLKFPRGGNSLPSQRGTTNHKGKSRSQKEGSLGVQERMAREKTQNEDQEGERGQGHYKKKICTGRRGKAQVRGRGGNSQN